MGRGLFTRRSGKPPALSPEVADALAELMKLVEQRPTLAAPCAVLRQTLPALFADSGTQAPPCLSRESAHAKLAAGVPLLHGEKVVLDAGALHRRWQAVCQAVAAQNHNAKAVADRYSALDVPDLLAEVLAGRAEAVHARADALDLDAALTATVLRFAALPVLSRFADALAKVCAGFAWDHGHCPTCGSWPLLAELRGLDQGRVLRCGLCASAWPFPRLRCPFCGSSDHRRLGYFHVEGEEMRYRTTTCDACRGYVKTVFTLAALSTPRLLVADLATLHLDLAAVDRGFFVV